MRENLIQTSEKTGPKNRDYDPERYVSPRVQTLATHGNNILHPPRLIENFLQKHIRKEWELLNPHHQTYLQNLLIKFEPIAQLVPHPKPVTGLEILGLGPQGEPYHTVIAYCKEHQIPRALSDFAFLVHGIHAVQRLMEEWKELPEMESRQFFFSLNLNPEIINHPAFHFLLESRLTREEKQHIVFEVQPGLTGADFSRLAGMQAPGPLRLAADGIDLWDPTAIKKAQETLQLEWAKLSASYGLYMLTDYYREKAREKEKKETASISPLPRGWHIDGRPPVIQGVEDPAWTTALKSALPLEGEPLWAQGFGIPMPEPFGLRLREIRRGADSRTLYMMCGTPRQEPDRDWTAHLHLRPGDIDEPPDPKEQILKLQEQQAREDRNREQKGRSGSYHPDDWVSARVNDTDGMKVMFRWLEDRGTPFCAVLGEYGTGKTFLVRMFRSKCVEKIKLGHAYPVPLLLDFKLMGPITKRAQMPTLEDIITDILRAQGIRNLEGEQVLKMAYENEIFLIFDGIDEQTVNLTPKEAYHFWRQLRRAVAVIKAKGDSNSSGSATSIYEDEDGEDKVRYTKAVLTCRTHYFKNFKDREKQMTGQRLEGYRDRDFTLALLNLFDRNMMADYIRKAIGKEQQDEVLKFIDEVYNLKDLAERPYLLSLMVEHFNDLREQIEHGRGVATAAGLYELVVDSWLDRDFGKHNLDPELKEELMEELAFTMWQRGVSVINVREMDRWLARQLPRLSPGMGTSSDDMSLMRIDFRTATFIGWKDEEGNFKFLHRSMMEFFLAKKMVRQVKVGQDIKELWDIPGVSREAWSFLVDLISVKGRERVKAAVGQTVATLLESDYQGRISNNALDLLLQWRKLDPAAPRLWRLALAGSRNLDGIELEGLDLEELDIRGAVLRDIGFRKLTCRIIRAGGAKILGAEWEKLEVEQFETAKAKIGGGRFNCCNIDFWAGKEMTLTGVAFLHTRVKELRWPGSEMANTSFAYCLLESIKLSGAAVRHTAFAHTRAEAHPIAPLLHGSNRRIHCPNFPGLPNERNVPSSIGVFTGHGMAVNCLTYSPDGTQFMSGSEDGTIKIWDAKSGICLMTLEEQATPVMALHYSPGGTKFISGSGDATIKVWAAKTGACLREIKKHSKTVRVLQYSPDGTQFISGSDDGTIKVWNAKAYTCIRTLKKHSAPIFALRYSPDGKKFLSGSGDTSIRIWDTKTGACIKTLTAHPDYIKALDYTRDGTKFISGSFDTTIKIWDAISYTFLSLEKEHTFGLNALQYSPDGTQFISTSTDHGINMWDAKTGSCLRTSNEHSKGVSALQYSPDGTQFISASLDNTIKIWCAQSGICLRTLQEYRRNNFSASYSPDGKTFITNSSLWKDKTFKFWDAETGTYLGEKKVRDYAKYSQCSPDKTKRISGSYESTIILTDLETGSLLLELFLLPENQYAAFDHRKGKYTAYSKYAYRYIGWNLGTLRLPLETFEE